ncbi:MAG TPA: hypothetical protein VF708_11745 [Pyrinomonadaceae bacterium]|jgi:hypothetical protein
MPVRFYSKELFALKILLLLILFAATSFAQAKELPEQRAAITGTEVSLIPPVGFTPSPQFPGYWEESLGASIQVTEFPAPYSITFAALSDTAQLTKRGISLLSRREVSVGRLKGMLLQVRQSASGLEYLKWILNFGDEEESVSIVATFPKGLEKELSEKLKRSILTATWEKERNIPPTEGLDFTIVDKGEMILAKRVANVLIYTKDGMLPKLSNDEPLFVAGSSVSKINVEERENFAKSRIAQTATITDIGIEQSENITIDNLAGYEVVAKGKDIVSGQEMVIYQTILFKDQGYYIMVGLISSTHRQVYLPVFKGMTESFKRNK